MEQKRIRDYGIQIGEMPTGKLNKISDVPGVKVGHATLDDARHKTGLSVILPGPDNVFLNKPVAAAHVLNGFGKTLGLMQLQELGVIETPIALTNTLNVGRIHDAMVGYMIETCQKADYRLTSVNPIVCECNDAGLNDIQDRALGAEHLRTGKPIVYTSADSVFQIAANEAIVPLEELYRDCQIARELLTGELEGRRRFRLPAGGAGRQDLYARRAGAEQPRLA